MGKDILRIAVLWWLVVGVAAPGWAQPVFQWAIAAPGSVGTPGGDDAGQALVRDSVGNVYIAGLFTGRAAFADGGNSDVQGAGSTDIFIAKYDPAGALLWVRHAGGAGQDQATGIALDPAGNVLVTGSFSGTADFDPGPGILFLSSRGREDAFVWKLDGAGQVLWARAMGGTQSDAGIAICTGADGAIFLSGTFSGTADFDPGTGTFNLTPAGSTDIFFMQLSAQGDFRWVRQIGGAGQDLVREMVLSGDQLCLTGSFSGRADFDPGAGTAQLAGSGGADGFLAVYTREGNYSWARRIGGPGADEVLDITADNQGDLYLTGFFTDSLSISPDTSAGIPLFFGAGASDAFFLRFDQEGAFKSGFRLGGSGSEQGSSLSLDDQGNIFLAGMFSGALDFDPGPDSLVLQSSGEQDIFLARYDSNGGVVWAAPVGGFLGESVADIDAGGDGRLAVTGFFRLEADFDPGPGAQNISSGGADNDAFLAHYLPDGRLDWVLGIGRYGLASDNQNRAIAADASGNIYMTGSFTGTADFDPGMGLQLFDAQGAGDAFVARFDPGGNLAWVSRVSGSGAEAGTDLVFDQAGRVYALGNFSGNAAIISAGDTFRLERPTPIPAFFLARYSSGGRLELAFNPEGNAGYTGASLCLDNTGSVYVTGTFNGAADFDPGPGVIPLGGSGAAGAFVARYDALGNCLWAREVGAGAVLQPQRIQTDAAGNLVIAGTFSGTANFDPGASDAVLVSAGGGLDVFIAGYGPDGNFRWAKSFGGSGLEQLGDMSVTPGGDILLTGNFNGTTDFDPGEGQILRQALIFDAFILALDSAGAFRWVHTLPSIGISNGAGLALGPAGTLYAAGFFQGTVTFTPGTPPQSSTLGGQDLFLIQLKQQDGSVEWTGRAGGAGKDQPYALAYSGLGRLYMAGAFNQTTTYGSQTLQSKNGEDGFLLSYQVPGQAQVAISGRITSVGGTPLAGVRVELSGAEQQAVFTDTNGDYRFADLSSGDFEVRPQSPDTGYLAGVTVMDMIALGRHLLGIHPLSSPFGLIAADVNQSASLTSLDLLLMRQLILGQRARFPAQVWRYADAAFRFDPARPFAFPESIRFTALQGQATADFIGIKTGDVEK